MRRILLLLLTATAWAGLPARFESNRGQSPEAVKFLARGEGQSIFLTKSGAVFHLAGSGTPAAVELQFEGSTNAELEGDTQLPGIANYFRGDKPEGWITNIPTYSRVRYKNLYPGIDVVFYTAGGHVEFDWVIAPHGDPSKIQFSLKGAAVPVLNDAGDLLVETSAGSFSMLAPILWQEGRRVGGSYTMKNGKAGIATGGYNRALPLVVDPVIAYHARFGTRPNAGVPVAQVSLLQGLNRGGAAVKVDGQGNAYVCGSTLIADFPVTPGVVQPVFGGESGPSFSQNDVFITKLSPDGKTILFSTYLGGAAEDVCLSMALDGAGNAFVTGYSMSSNFPTTSGAFQTKGANGTLSRGFVTKLSPNGNTLLYSTVLSTDAQVESSSIAVDPAGNAYVAGVTFSPTFPTTPGAFSGSNPMANFTFRAYVLKLNPSGSDLVFGSNLGLASSSIGQAVPRDTTVSVAIDSSTNVYIGGTTNPAQPNFSAPYPTTDGAFQTKVSGNSDGFISKLSPDGSRLIYSTLLGGQGLDGVDSIAVDPQGQVVVIGHTDSTDFPATTSALWPAPNPEFPAARTRYPSYGMAAKINATGTALLYSTYIGGGGSIVLSSVALDSQNNILIAGSQDAPTFPITPDAFQHCIGNSNNWSNAILMKLSPGGEKLLFASYLGGNVRDQGLAMTVDRSNAVYITGMTDSVDFLPTPGAVSDPLGTTFITKIDMATATPNHLDCVVNATTMSGGPLAPFEIVSIQGTGITPKDMVAKTNIKDGLIDTSSLNTRVLFDGAPAPIISISPGQIYAIVPQTVAFRTTTKVQVEQAGQLSNAISLPVTTSISGLFTSSNSGIGQAAVINEDGTVNSAANPAPRNSVVSFFGQGLFNGNGLPPRVAGQVATSSQSLGFAIIQIGGVSVQPLYSGTAPGFSMSLLQVNARIPANSAVGPRVPVALSLGSGFASQRTFIAVK